MNHKTKSILFFSAIVTAGCFAQDFLPWGHFWAMGATAGLAWGFGAYYGDFWRPKVKLERILEAAEIYRNYALENSLRSIPYADAVIKNAKRETEPKP